MGQPEGNKTLWAVFLFIGIGGLIVLALDGQKIIVPSPSPAPTFSPVPTWSGFPTRTPTFAPTKYTCGINDLNGPALVSFIWLTVLTSAEFLLHAHKLASDAATISEYNQKAAPAWGCPPKHAHSMRKAHCVTVIVAAVLGLGALTTGSYVPDRDCQFARLGANLAAVGSMVVFGLGVFGKATTFLINAENAKLAARKRKKGQKRMRQKAGKEGPNMVTTEGGGGQDQGLTTNDNGTGGAPVAATSMSVGGGAPPAADDEEVVAATPNAKVEPTAEQFNTRAADVEAAVKPDAMNIELAAEQLKRIEDFFPEAKAMYSEAGTLASRSPALYAKHLIRYEFKMLAWGCFYNGSAWNVLDPTAKHPKAIYCLRLVLATLCILGGAGGVVCPILMDGPSAAVMVVLNIVGVLLAGAGVALLSSSANLTILAAKRGRWHGELTLPVSIWQKLTTRKASCHTRTLSVEGPYTVAGGLTMESASHGNDSIAKLCGVCAKRGHGGLKVATTDTNDAALLLKFLPTLTKKQVESVVRLVLSVVNLIVIIMRLLRHIKWVLLVVAILVVVLLVAAAISHCKFGRPLQAAQMAEMETFAESLDGCFINLRSELFGGLVRIPQGAEYAGINIDLNPKQRFVVCSKDPKCGVREGELAGGAICIGDHKTEGGALVQEGQGKYIKWMRGDAIGEDFEVRTRVQVSKLDSTAVSFCFYSGNAKMAPNKPDSDAEGDPVDHVGFDGAGRKLFTQGEHWTGDATIHGDTPLRVDTDHEIVFRRAAGELTVEVDGEVALQREMGWRVIGFGWRPHRSTIRVAHLGITTSTNPDPEARSMGLFEVELVEGTDTQIRLRSTHMERKASPTGELPDPDDGELAVADRKYVFSENADFDSDRQFCLLQKESASKSVLSKARLELDLAEDIEREYYEGTRSMVPVRIVSVGNAGRMLVVTEKPAGLISVNLQREREVDDASVFVWKELELDAARVQPKSANFELIPDVEP